MKTGTRPLGQPVAAVVLCSASSPFTTSPSTFLNTAHFYTSNTFARKERHSLWKLQCYLVAKAPFLHTKTKPALWWLSMQLQTILHHYRTCLFSLCFKLTLLIKPFTLSLFIWNNLITILHYVLSHPFLIFTTLYLQKYGFHSELTVQI